jgi:hypothetical protein
VARSICGAVLVAVSLIASGTTSVSEATPREVGNWRQHAWAFARAVNVRASDIPESVRPRMGVLTVFSAAPLACSCRQAAQAGGSSIVPTPDGLVASAVSVRASTRVAIQQMRDLLTSSGQVCLGRSLGEAGVLLQAQLMSFEVTARTLGPPKDLGGEAAGRTVLAEMTTAADLVRDSQEAHRLGHPTTGAKTIHVSGVVFRVGPAQILLMIIDERGEPSRTEMYRLLRRLHNRAVEAILS